MDAAPFMRFVVYFGTDSQVALVVKNLPVSAGDARDEGWIRELGRSHGERNGYPLQYSPVAKSWTQLKQPSTAT